MLQNGENHKSILIFYPNLWNFETGEKTSNLKAHNNEKMEVKEKKPYFNIIQTNSKSEKYLKNLAE